MSTDLLSHLLEEWYSVMGDESSNTLRDPDCFVITARLGIDGGGFEGIYRRSASGNSGQIAGRVLAKSVSPKSKQAEESLLGACAAVLCSAQSHLAVILGDAASSDLDYFREDIDGAVLRKFERNKPH